MMTADPRPKEEYSERQSECIFNHLPNIELITNRQLLYDNMHSRNKKVAQDLFML